MFWGRPNMASWDESHEQDTLAEALGLDDASGFHIEVFYQTSPFWEVPRRGDGSRFPCIDAENVYSGCLGSQCPATRCWAGRLVPSAPNAPAERVALPRIERKGATCHRCVWAVDTSDGKVDCARGHFDQPITPACLVRRRIPDPAPIPCPDFVKRDELRSDVAAFRKARRDKARKVVEDAQDDFGKQAG